jgi:hypothetical protein
MNAITSTLGHSLNSNDLSSLSDSALHDSIHRVAAREREATQDLIEHLAEVDRRRSFLALGFSSLHDFAVKSLKLSDGAAARRIQAVRLSRDLPEVVDQVRTGDVSLSNVSLLQTYFFKESRAGHAITPEEKREWVETSKTLSARQLLRKIDTQASPEVRAELRERARPLGGEHTELKLVVSEKFMSDLTELKELLSHGDHSTTAVLEQALSHYLSLQRKKRYGNSEKPAPESASAPTSAPRLSPAATPTAEPHPATVPPKNHDARTFPVSVQRAVWNRARGQCEFTAKTGLRCSARSTLQVDHIHPFAMGGRSTFNNARLLCRLHNTERVARMSRVASGS